MSRRCFICAPDLCHGHTLQDITDVALDKSKGMEVAMAEMEVDETEVQSGDDILAYTFKGKRLWVTAPSYGWVVSRVDTAIHLTDGSLFHTLGQSGGITLKVRRKAELRLSQPTWQGRTTTVSPGKKAIPDWPLKCPRCARSESAVLLFMGYDCKHGCFK